MILPDQNLDNDRFMRSVLQRIATGPELSKDLDYEEARRAMSLILDEAVDPVQAGVFLIALRMKRETDEENKGVLQAILDVTEVVDVSLPEVLYIADPFDGYARGLPASPFVPAVLAACGIPTVTQGAESVGPKYGVTHRKVLQAAGIDVNLTLQQAARQLESQSIGWCYVDQRVVCPKLHQLVPLRSLIVKRPCLTTVEVLPKPFATTSHLVTGYVHKPYPPIYMMLARHAGYESAAIIRGVEGGVVPSLQQASKYHYYVGLDQARERRLHPDDVDVKSNTRAVPLPADLPAIDNKVDAISIAVDTDALATASAKAGLAALQGETGATHDSIVFSAAICLLHCRKCDSLLNAANRVREVLKNGRALSHFTAAR